jgi:hypothetical protein
MINFNNINVNRLVIHTINAKQAGQDCSTIDASNEILDIDDSVLNIIRNRLTNALGRNSKSFELEIENHDDGSFFSLSLNMNTLDDQQFIIKSIEIAELLAECQRKVTIPGGYLLIMECLDTVTNLNLSIVIKAEPHEALQYSNEGGHTQISLLNKVFLSPSQKLFKIGVIFRKNDSEINNVNDSFGCILYDDQFRVDSHPAEYFYKDFLGFSIANNAKIQTQRFYDKTRTFILNNVPDINLKNGLLSVLKNEFIVNLNDTINPFNFANDYFSNQYGLRDRYIVDVCHELPNSIIKEQTLINSKLQKRKIDFSSNINLIGPEDEFDNNVSIITTDAELNNLELNNEIYTILKINGKPYSANE